MPMTPPWGECLVPPSPRCPLGGPLCHATPRHATPRHATPALKQHSVAESGPVRRAHPQQPLTSKSPPPCSFLLCCFPLLCSNFGDFQEPYYRNYISTPLAPLFEEAGLKCGMKVRGGAGLAASQRQGPVLCCAAACRLLCRCCAAVLLCCCGSAAVQCLMWLSWSPPLLLHPAVQVVGSSTKSLSFFKPQEDDVNAVGGSAEAAAASAAAGVAAEAQEDE